MDEKSKKLLELLLMETIDIFNDRKRAKALISDYFANDKLIKTLLILSIEEGLPLKIYNKIHIRRDNIYKWQKSITDLCGCKDDLAMEVVCSLMESFIYYDINRMVNGKVYETEGAKTFVRIIERLDIVKELRIVEYNINGLYLDVREWLHSMCLVSTNIFDIYKYYQHSGNLIESYKYAIMGEGLDIDFIIENNNYISYITEIEVRYNSVHQKKISKLSYVVGLEEKELMRDWGLFPKYDNVFEGLKILCMDKDESVLCFDTYTSKRGVYNYEILAFGKECRRFLGLIKLSDVVEESEYEECIIKRSPRSLTLIISDNEGHVKKKISFTKEIMNKIEKDSEKYLGVAETSIYELYEYLKVRAINHLEV